MKTKKWIIGLASLLTASTVTGLAIITRAQTPSPSLPPGVSPEEHKLHHPENNQPTLPQKQATQVDQQFIEMMILHHQEAVDMADLALTRANRTEVKNLAQAIKQDQAREIAQMRTWYKQWFGKEVPATMPMGGMMQGNGMMSQSMMQGNRMMNNQGMMQGNGMQRMHSNLNALKTAKDFDREFIRQMIPHHQMAVRMAQMLEKKTTRPEMKTLAQAIIKSQTAEINQMKQWQKSWFK